jgi:hypothetical protein
MTSSDFGTLFSSSAVVESRTRSTLIDRFGSVAGREPVARMPTSNVIVSSPPPVSATEIVFGSTMVARPCT